MKPLPFTKDVYDECNDLLTFYEVPKMRRDLCDLSNVRWLLRNIQCSDKNKQQETLSRVINLLKMIEREGQRAYGELEFGF